MNGKYLTLAARIQETLPDLENVVKRAKMQLDKARVQQDDSHLDGAALNLHGFYTGVEQIFENIGRTIDGSLPTGPNWHKELLLQMSVEINSVRPAIIERETRDCLDQYRGFRHIVRNVYTFNLRPDRLEELVSALPSCLAAVQADLTRFVETLKINGK